MTSKISVDTLWYRFKVHLCFHITTMLEVFANILHNLYVWRRNKAQMPDSLVGQVIVITGANSGIGKDVAKICLERDATVVMVCRSKQKADEAIAEIGQTVTKDKIARLHFVEMDLASLGSVRTAAAQIAGNYPHIDVLINNAGVMMCPEWASKDGHEMQFATNHLGHFLFTNLLLDSLSRAPVPARVVTLASVAHIPGTIHFDNINLKNSYTPLKAYQQSKLANVQFAIELQKRLAKQGSAITSYAVHPGLVRTELGRHFNKAEQLAIGATNRLILISPEFGMQTTLFCAFDARAPQMAGGYFA